VTTLSQGKHGRARRRAVRTRRRLLVLALVPAVLSVGTAAYAYWSATGAGAAEVKATTAKVLAVSSLATPLADLYPGNTSDLGFMLTNPNSYPVSLTRLTAVSVTSSDQAACSGGTYISLPSAVTTGVAGSGYVLPTPISVPAGSTSTTATLAGLVTMTTSAPDACQGKTFTVSMTFTGSQV
jgi:hypothetical protein